MINCLCHSVHCSKQPSPFLKPACSLRSLLSTAVFILAMIILLKILLGIEIKVIPLQLLQLVRSPFFVSMMMYLITQGRIVPSLVDISSSGSGEDF